MPAPRRTVAEILDELATLEQYLAEAPPHSGSGPREQLQHRIGELHRELARVRRDATSDGRSAS